jgi:CelD/BcsL family acetyltransferase involved in cellulose biosynthesis
MTHTLAVDELGGALLDTWSAMQQATPALASPFYRPEFFQAVHGAHQLGGQPGPVTVAVITDAADAVVGFWPFEREAPRLAVPAGRFLNDYQGVISDPGLQLDALGLLADAGLDRWRFDHLPPDQPGFGRFVTGSVVSPQIDVSRGWEHVRATTSAAPRLEPAIRRLERDLGPVRFELTQDRSALDTLMRWKSRQYVEAGKNDIFSIGWCRELARMLVATTAPELHGHLTSLWAGDLLLAVHLGLQSGATLHYWLPAYDRSFARYSPGLVLLLHLVREGPALGIDLIDLGKGREPYKERLADRGVRVGQGVAERSTLALRARKSAHLVKSGLRRAGRPRH